MDIHKKFFFLILLFSCVLLTFINGYAQVIQGCPEPYTYAVDPYWPKPLPNNWLLGQVSAIDVDSNNHVWLIHRPHSFSETERGAALKPPISKCCIPAPPVIEFDEAGNIVRSWGGPGKGYDWPSKEHGLYIDYKGFVWITGIGENDGQILKFTRDGKFVMQIGKVGPQTGSNDTTRLGRAAAVNVDPATNELFVADGYYNHRVIVFDANTGAYKRHWGAYGKPPKDLDTTLLELHPPTAASLQQFGTPVHCVRFNREGLLYVCDRRNNRIQVFHKDGTYVKEFFVEPQTAAMGSVWDIIFSKDPKQCYIYIIDGSNNQLHTLLHKNHKVISSFSRQGRYAGQFHWVHDMAMDAKGNLYTGEVDEGKRIQKFIRKIKK